MSSRANHCSVQLDAVAALFVMIMDYIKANACKNMFLTIKIFKFEVLSARTTHLVGRQKYICTAISDNCIRIYPTVHTTTIAILG